METSIAPVAPPVVADVTAKPEVRPSSARWKAEIEQSRAVTKELADGVWKTNVEYRRGKPFKEEVNADRVSVPVDWSMTKSKEAGLFSQVPSVSLTPKHDRYKPVIPVLQQELNTVLTEQVDIATTMEEVLADIINASGVAGVMCGFLATFRTDQTLDKSLDLYPGETQESLLASGQAKLVDSVKMVDCRFYADRLSPSQLLWPKNFHGSNFDKADWVGYDGTCTWAEALREMAKDDEAGRPNGLTQGMKEQVCGGAESRNTLSPNAEPDADEETVSYTRLFYWAARFDPDCLYLEKIRHLVFVNGIDEPVIDEDYKSQKWSDEIGAFVGVTKFPLRIGTLTYISDMPVPPSDSEIGRPQVDESMRSRSQMILQRDRSAPMRWANVNRIDPMVMQALGTGDSYQRIIPVNGEGDKAIGEVARANYPKEDWEFDRVGKQDLMDAWQVGPNQTGSFNTAGRTAAEANIVQSGFQTRQAKERGKISKLFCSIAEVILGLMQMHYEGPKEASLVGDDGMQRLAQWDRQKVSAIKCVASIREDSTVKLDSQQRLQQIEKFLNLAGKSGFANVQYLVEEMAQLSALDPAKATTKPNPKEPEPPNISLRAGGEDLSDPIVGPYLIALMQKGHPVTVEEVTAAMQLLIKSSTPPDPNAPPPPPAAMPGQPPVAPGAHPPAAPGPPAPQPPKDYGPMERVTKRINEPGG